MLAYMNRFLRVSTTATFYAFLPFLLIACSKNSGDNSVSHQSASSDKPSEQTYGVIEWTDLLPDEDLHALENPPEQLSDIEDGSEGDELASQLKAKISSGDTPKDPYEQALVSKNIRPEFDGRNVRIPGFIVPIDFDDQQTITTFFLVPFFGACIHLPPPPPNQIIYAEYEPGIKLEALYGPFWVDGTLATTIIENELAT